MQSSDRSRDLAAADRFATRACTALGALAGGLLGIVRAPSIEILAFDRPRLGVGIAIVAAFAVGGVLLGWRASRVLPWRER